jgi:outer membrane protein TolC
MSFEGFMKLVKENHPIAQQANLQLERGEANLLAAKGGFDPQLFTNIGQKYFNNDQYYSLVNSGLKIPTWFGLSVEGGFEQNNGINLNPERKTPSNGLVYGGLSLAVGQGLFIDQRRADLRQAQAFERITVEERRLMLNNLLLNASNTYWEWFNAYQLVEINKEGLRLAEERFEGIRESAILGDLPPIDTIEALIQVQARTLNLQEAQRNYFNQTGWLNVYLWSSDGIPYEIENNVVPVPLKNLEATIFNDTLQNQISTMIQQHPVIRRNELRLRQLEIERRWKIEQLKPVLNLKYNALNQPINQDLIAGYSMNNYNWGLQFYMPILLRKGRGELKLTNIKIKDQLLQLDLQEEQLTFHVKAAINDWNTYNNQLTVVVDNVKNLTTLLNGERRKFEVGESSIFLVNTRETSYIQGLIQQASLVTRNQKSLVEISYHLGNLGD